MKKTVMLLLVAFLMAVNAIGQCKPTKDEFFKACDSLEIHHPYVVWAQARLESGNFTSAHYRNRHNCLGIYDSKNKRYAYFGSWQECLSAYKTRFQYRCSTPDCTDEEYLRWVANAGYAKNPTYYDSVIKIVNQEKRKDGKQ